MTTEQMIREYKANGGKVTQCPTKYNNDSTNVNSKTSKGRVVHYKNRMRVLKPIGKCKENKDMKYY